MKKNARRCTRNCVIPKIWTRNFGNYQRPVVLRVLCVMTLETMLSLQSKGSCITCDGKSSLRDYFKTAQRRRTSEQRCECVRAKKGRPSQISATSCSRLPKDLDAALTVKTPEKMGFYSGPSRPTRTQSRWSSICRIIVRTKRRIFFG